MHRLEIALVVLVVVACATESVRGDAKPNPYLTISDRNAFSLKTPPPPPPPPEAAVPVVPLAKVVLTGITSMFGPTPKVLLEITEQESGKAPTVKKPILREGERDGSVEVLSIDVAKSVVRIRNGSIETNVMFEVAKSSPGPAPSIPGLMPPVPPSLPNAHASAAMGSPTIISPGGVDSPGRAGSGVSTYGGANTSIPSPTVNPASTYANANAGLGSSYANAGINFNRTGIGVNTYGATDPNQPSFQRPLRTDGQASGQAHPTAIQNYTAVEQLREASQKISQTRGIPPLPLPPTALTRQKPPE